MKNIIAISYDYVGIFISILCGFHCLITPILIIYLPIIGNAVENIWFHTGIMGFMAFAFYHSIYKHFKLHNSKLTLALGLGGVILFLVSYINEVIHLSGDHKHGEHLHDVHGDETSMIYIAITGAILLVSSHILNIRKCKCFNSNGVCSSEE